MTRQAAGFTLIEVLVTLAILGLLLVMLTEGAQSGVRAWNAYAALAHPQADVEPVERALRHLIERMDPGVYPEPPLVRGTSTTLAFTTLLAGFGTADTVEADVRLESPDGSLLLWWTPHGRGTAFGAPPATHRIVLLEGARLELKYAAKDAGAAWQARWTQEALPGLVRLRLVLPDGRSWPPVVVRPLREAAEQ